MKNKLFNIDKDIIFGGKINCNRTIKLKLKQKALLNK